MIDIIKTVWTFKYLDIRDYTTTQNIYIVLLFYNLQIFKFKCILTNSVAFSL